MINERMKTLERMTLKSVKMWNVLQALDTKLWIKLFFNEIN